MKQSQTHNQSISCSRIEHPQDNQILPYLQPATQSQPVSVPHAASYLADATIVHDIEDTVPTIFNKFADAFSHNHNCRDQARPS